MIKIISFSLCMNIIMNCPYIGGQIAGNSNRRVLVFGGNGFIGSEVVSRLIDHGDNITIVNRGHWYFDSKERIKPFIHQHFKCDRDKALMLECRDLLTSGYYDVVIDFSSYTARQIQQVVNVLKDRVGIYIYISTDSIYEVCQKHNVAPSKEEDAVRPKSPKKRLQLKKTDKYGHEKLACEEVLQEQRKTGGFPYVALRLPDVIGPRDGSFRFWTYQLWIHTHTAIEHPVHLPNGVANTKFSLVHVEDVANSVERILKVGPKAYDQAINLAFEEHFTLKQLLGDIGKQLKVEDIIYLTDEETAWYTYPTVTKGPLDINKAKLLLDWYPMPWEKALRSLTTFYEDAMVDKMRTSEKEMVLADFMEYHVPEEKYEIFLRALKKVYGDEVFDGIDLEFGFEKDAMELEGSVAGAAVNHTNASRVNSEDEFVEIQKEDQDEEALVEKKEDGKIENESVIVNENTKEKVNDEL